MVNTNTLVKSLQSPWMKFVILIGVIAGVIEIYNVMKDWRWCLIAVLGLGVVLLVIWLFQLWKVKEHLEGELKKANERAEAANERVKLATEVAGTTQVSGAELIKDDSTVAGQMTALLEEIAMNKGRPGRSLSYYGGVGFIGNHPPWRTLYKKILEDHTVTLVRLVDLKGVWRMKGNVLNKMNRGLRKIDLREYCTWIETHRDNLDERKEGRDSHKNNFFYPFEGAPLWKYGIHVIVFSDRHVALTFLSHSDPEVEHRKAIIIRNNEDIAKAIKESMNWQIARLKPTALNSTDLSKALLATRPK